MSDERRVEVGEVEGDGVREEELEMEEDYESEEFKEMDDDGGGEIEIGEDGQMYASDKWLKAASIDRLSALPDVLLIHILSRLWCVKKAAVTSVLSKRWQYLWTDLPELEFRESSTEIEETRKLVTHVHRALILRTEKYLDSLIIHFAYNKCFASDLNVWIEFVVKNKVKKLCLELHSSSDFHLIPQDSRGILGPLAKGDLDCDLPHLKTVVITYYADPNLGGETMLTLARILLKRATNLEKMVIDGMRYLAEFSADASINISRALLRYPTSSQIAEVIFQP